MADASPTAAQLLADAAWLRRLATALAGNAVDADDLVQESWIAAWRRKPDGDRPLGPWLAKVVRDLAGMRRRSEARRAAREQTAEEAPAIAAPDALLDRMRLHRQLVDLVLELAEPYRSTIVARFFEGKSAAAIARAHGVPASTVRGRLRDGLARLRDQLDAARGERKAWAPVALALARGGARMAKPTKAIAVIVAAILALLAGAIFFITNRHAPARERAASPIAAHAIPGREGSGAGGAPAVPSWFAPRGVGPRRVAGRVTFDGAPVAGASVSLHSALTEAGVAPA